MIRYPRPTSLPLATDKLVVVEASAGTGKTYFLEHRVVDLVLAGAELGQILLVTFTDKAVAELRLRIRDLLDKLSRITESGSGEDDAWILDDDARKRLRAAVTSFDHAPIFTIHGFCHRVLIEDAFAARRLFDQTQVADEVAFDAAYNALLRERFARISPDRELLAAFLETEKSVDDLRDLLLACARADATSRRGFDAEAAMFASGSLREMFGTPAKRAQVRSMIPSQWIDGWLKTIELELDACPADATPARQLALVDACRHPLTKICTQKKLLPAIGDAIREITSAVSLREAVAATLLPPVLERIGLDKAEHGQFDYDDMLRLVWDALRGPRGPELAARLRLRMPWAMIDEFQDTDPTQWQIFRTVWMHIEAKGLTIVGDPKQAIYSFRGADVATYVAARDEMLRNGATRIALDVCRRSTESLVEAVNGILLGPTKITPLLDKAITYDEPVRASGDITIDDLRPPVTVLALQSGKGQTDACKLALATAIGDAIDRLRRAPPTWSSRGTAQAFSLGQAMVLTRTNRDSSEIASALRARGLPCALVEPERLFRTREAAELAAVLSAIAAPRDRSARLRALRTRFFDVPWTELMRVVDAPDHHPAIARLFDWAQLASRRMYEPLFRRLVEDSRYAERALVLGGGERAITNTWHLIELLLAELARSRCDLHELVAQLRRWIVDDTGHPDERDVQRADDDRDAIRVLTIHKAKGLEAPYVFLYGGTGSAPKARVHALRDGAGRALIVGQPSEAIEKQLADEADGENQRLAYVALTRAQVRLYLPVYGDGTLKSDAAYGPIQRSLAPWLGPRPVAGRVMFEKIDVPVGGPADPPAPADVLDGFTAAAAPAVRELVPLAPERAGLAMLSYTRLAHDPNAKLGDLTKLRRDELDPAELNIDDGSGEVGPSDLPPGADSGLMLHDALEVVDLAAMRGSTLAGWFAEPRVQQQLRDAARHRGIDPRYLPHAAQLVHAAFTRPLAIAGGGELPPLADATALAREVEFSYPLESRGGLVRGFMDALVAWDDDELWVLDYKSDVLAGEPIAAAERRVREHYSVQARLYAIAAERMRGGRQLAGLLFQFLRHDVTVQVRVDDILLANWTMWLSEVRA